MVDLVVDIDQSQLISPHVKQLCQGSSGAIYTSDNDIRRTATGTKSLMCLFFTLDCKFEWQVNVCLSCHTC